MLSDRFNMDIVLLNLILKILIIIYIYNFMSNKNSNIQSITISLESNELKTNNISQLLEYKLKNLLENKCGEYGFVKKNSVKIIQRSYGIFKIVENRSVILYNINYVMEAINPLKNDILECIISNSTKMGCIAYVQYEDDEEEYTLKTSPLLIIIPRNYLKEEYSEGEKVNIEVITSKVKYNSKQIQIIAKPVD